MMGRLNHDQAQLFYSFHLDEAVPHDHPIRKIAAVLDLSWVRSELAPFYPEMGRPSIDPEHDPDAHHWQCIRNSLVASYMPGCTGESRLSLVLWALDRGQNPGSLGLFTCPS